MITVRDLTCRLGGKLLFDGLSFSVRKGSYTALVGPNGTGKTTLLRCIDRIWDDWSGVILIGDRNVRDYTRRELSQKLAILEQVVGDVPLTARQYVTCARYPFLSRFSSLSRHDREVVSASMTAMGVIDFADRFCSQLSGGERQKVFLAAALAQEPELLLLDEPTTFLDYRHQAEITSLLLNWAHRHGTTILEVTHDLNHAAAFSDEVLALAHGRIQFQGSPRDLMTPVTLEAIYHTPLTLVASPSGVPVALLDRKSLPVP